ncbi:MAG: xanthine dehydrogenase fad-binding subunit, partial [Phenylobacterium sp.]|nr:xanthine dehydrogenase fad-binding subunit [Phenylobacterium sp.]
MRAFIYERATSPAEATRMVATRPGARFLGGGTNLLDLMKHEIETPSHLVDVNHLGLDRIEDTADGGLRIGAQVRNSDLAVDPRVRARYGVLSRALLAGASGQLRNRATTGGNLLQRTRCYYFYNPEKPCNKREPGSGCSALEGYGRYNAILGASEACVAVHPSDLAVALAALDAVVVVLGPDGERRVPFADLHRLPGHHPERDTSLGRDELITALELTAGAVARHSTYEKARDRASYAFALVSVAAGLELDGDVVRDVRLAWGGAAHKPWRARLAEDVLRGERFTEELAR